MTAAPPPLPSTPARMAPGPFALAVIAVYALSFVSQMLLSPPVTGRFNVLPFVLAQLVLIAAWIVLHRRRLHDAGRATGMVTGIAAIYTLEIVLIVLLIGLLLSAPVPSGGASGEASVFQLFVLLYFLSLMSGDPTLGSLQIWMLGFAVLLLLPVAIGVYFSAWTAMRPRRPTH
jgi:uncharacterized membrane protein YhaH (DUF805 family)